MEIHGTACHAVEKVLQRHRGLSELKTAGNGELGPVFDVVERADQLCRHLGAELLRQTLVLKVGNERGDVVAQHREACLDIGYALHVVAFGFLKPCRLALQLERAAAKQQEGEEKGHSKDSKDDKAFVHLLSQIEHQEDLTDRMELEIARFLEQVSTNHLSDDTKTKIRRMLREVCELESIGDACYNLARTINRLHDSKKKFSDAQWDKVLTLMNLCDKALTQMVTIMSGHRYEHDIRETYRIENDINQMRQQLKNDNLQAVNDHEYDYATGTVFTDLVNECEKLGDYVVNVVQARFGK